MVFFFFSFFFFVRGEGGGCWADCWLLGGLGIRD